MTDLDLDAIKARVKVWDYHTSPDGGGRDYVLLTTEERDALVAAVERLRTVEALARAVDWSCVGSGLGIITQTRCVSADEREELARVEAAFDAFLAALHPQEPSDE